MRLNCKPGDLAVIVRAMYRPELIGRLVTCVRLIPNDGFDADGRPFSPKPQGGPRWVIEKPLGSLKSVSDSNLRPIRDQDGEDEMLRIAGLPNKEPANV